MDKISNIEVWKMWFSSSPILTLLTLCFCIFLGLFILAVFWGFEIERFFQKISIKLPFYEKYPFFGILALFCFFGLTVYTSLFDPRNNPKELLKMCQNRITQIIKERSLDKISKKEAEKKLADLVNMEEILKSHISDLEAKQQNDKRLQEIRKEDSEQYVEKLRKNQIDDF